MLRAVSGLADPIHANAWDSIDTTLLPYVGTITGSSSAPPIASAREFGETLLEIANDPREMAFLSTLCEHIRESNSIGSYVCALLSSMVSREEIGLEDAVDQPIELAKMAVTWARAFGGWVASAGGAAALGILLKTDTGDIDLALYLMIWGVGLVLAADLLEKVAQDTDRTTRTIQEGDPPRFTTN